jgi:hypothetical protein
MDLLYFQLTLIYLYQFFVIILSAFFNFLKILSHDINSPIKVIYTVEVFLWIFQSFIPQQEFDLIQVLSGLLLFSLQSYLVEFLSKKHFIFFIEVRLWYFFQLKLHLQLFISLLFLRFHNFLAFVFRIFLVLILYFRPIRIETYH